VPLGYHRAVRASLTSLGRRLPELAAELAHLADLRDRDAPEVLDRARGIADKAVRAICAEQGVEQGDSSAVEILVARNVIPQTIADHVRTLEDRELTLVGDAVDALVGFLEWRVGSRSNIISPRPAPRHPRRGLVIGVLGALVGAGTLISIVAWPHDPPRDTSRDQAAMVRIAGATFEMGSHPEELRAALVMCREVEHRTDCELDNELLAQEQLRKVVVSTYELDRDEVTVADYVAWLDREPSPSATVIALPGIDYTPESRRFSVMPGLDRMPIVGVTWHQARTYCEARGKRLPTEAEWELAARGVERRLFPWGSELPTCTEVIYARREYAPCDQVGTNGGTEAAPVGTAPKDVTPEGVRDLAGNVAEWTADAGGDRPRCAGPCVDPRTEGPPTATRVIRGGTWSGWLGWLRGAARSAQEPETTRTNIGFRCARGA